IFDGWGESESDSEHESEGECEHEGEGESEGEGASRESRVASREPRVASNRRLDAKIGRDMRSTELDCLVTRSDGPRDIRVVSPDRAYSQLAIGLVAESRVSARALGPFGPRAKRIEKTSACVGPIRPRAKRISQTRK